MSLRKKLKKEHTSSSNSVVHEITPEQTFTRYLPALFDNYFLTPTVTTDVYKEYTTVCPLLPAAIIRRVRLGNSVIHFIQLSPASTVAKLSPKL